jgi:hypothetical protein
VAEVDRRSVCGRVRKALRTLAMVFSELGDSGVALRAFRHRVAFQEIDGNGSEGEGSRGIVSIAGLAVCRNQSIVIFEMTWFRSRRLDGAISNARGAALHLKAFWRASAGF